MLWSWIIMTQNNLCDAKVRLFAMKKLLNYTIVDQHSSSEAVAPRI